MDGGKMNFTFAFHYETRNLCVYDIQPQETRNFWVYGVIIPHLVALGIATNIINICIFMNTKMRKTVINWFLIALSVSDFSMVSLSFCMLSLPGMADSSLVPSLINFANVTGRWAFPFGLMAQTFSVATTAALSAYRYFGVCYPFQSRRFCTPTAVKLAFGCMLAFTVIFNIPRFFELELVLCYVNGTNQTTYLVDMTSFRHSYNYQTVYLGYMYTFVMFVAPFLALIYMNSAIIWAMKRSISTRTKISASFRNRSVLVKVGNDAAERRTTFMLIAIVISFLVCNSFAFISNVLEILLKNGYGDLHEIFSIFVDISNCLAVGNCSINIIIYYTFMKKYRIWLSRLFKPFGENEDSETLLDSVSTRRRSHANSLITTSETALLRAHTARRPTLLPQSEHG